MTDEGRIPEGVRTKPEPQRPVPCVSVASFDLTPSGQLRSVRSERENPASVRSVGEAVRTLLDENTAARAGLKVVAGLIGATLVLLPLVVWRLRATGKAGDEILGPAFIGWPLVAGAILAALWWHDRSQLRPRQRRLEALGHEYERLD